MTLPDDGLILESYADVVAALGNAELVRSIDEVRFERDNILEGVLMMLDGRDHRERRLIENRLFRRDTLEQYERVRFPVVITRTLDRLVTDGRGDLLAIGASLTVELSAKTAGVDFDTDSLADRSALVRLLRVFARGISIDALVEDPEIVKGEVGEALIEFERDFYRASLERRRALVHQFEAGRLPEEELPRDILTTLLLAHLDERLGAEQLLRETGFFLEGGAHTSSQSLASSLHYIFEWAGTDDATLRDLARDPVLVQRCVHEALRLRPTNPLLRRRARKPTAAGGVDIVEGGFVYLNTYQANRDPSVFGADPASFNPRREIAASAARYGLTFGGGVHACIGRTLAIGYPIRDGAASDDHLIGLVTLMVIALLERGVRPDPGATPQLDRGTTRWTRWASYPVMIRCAADA